VTWRNGGLGSEKAIRNGSGRVSSLFGTVSGCAIESEEIGIGLESASTSDSSSATRFWTAIRESWLMTWSGIAVVVRLHRNGD
jgi:hypothetical protein